MLLDSHAFIPVEKLGDIALDRWNKIREPATEEWRKAFGNR